jgi:hypothetical protein
MADQNFSCFASAFWLAGTSPSYRLQLLGGVVGFDAFMDHVVQVPDIDSDLLRKHMDFIAFAPGVSGEVERGGKAARAIGMDEGLVVHGFACLTRLPSCG